MEYFAFGSAVLTWIGFGAIWWALRKHTQAMERHSADMKQNTEASSATVFRMEEAIYNLKQM